LARVEQYFAPFLSAMETGADLVLHAQGEPVNGVPPTVRWPRNLFIGGTVNMDETTYPFSDKVLDRAFTLEFWAVDLAAFLERRHQKGKRQELPEAVLLRAAKALVGVRRHFGYRTAEEYLDFVAAATQGSGEALQRSIVDRALFSKILPRVRGEDSPSMRDALGELSALCAEYSLSDCASKVREMEIRLASTGLTRFWA
jgi:5-methylcytosine-specific restriction enzyme B